MIRSLDQRVTTGVHWGVELYQSIGNLAKQLVSVAYASSWSVKVA